MGKPKYQKARRVTHPDHVRVANPKRAAGAHTIAASNKSGIHDTRPNRQRGRRAERLAAIREAA